MNIKQSLIGQFRQPHGLLGRLAGQIMANRPSNIARNQWMLDLMQLQAQDKCLEIGFGPGIALQGAMQQVSRGVIVGIDHSEIMLKQAQHRINSMPHETQIQLQVADIEKKPPFQIRFNQIYSANVVMFWQNPTEVFIYLKSLLESKGQLTTLFMPRHKGATSHDSYEKGELIQSWLRQAGFTNIKLYVKDFNGLAAVCVMATND